MLVGVAGQVPSLTPLRDIHIDSLNGRRLAHHHGTFLPAHRSFASVLDSHSAAGCTADRWRSG